MYRLKVTNLNNYRAGKYHAEIPAIEFSEDGVLVGTSFPFVLLQAMLGCVFSPLPSFQGAHGVEEERVEKRT